MIHGLSWILHLIMYQMGEGHLDCNGRRVTSPFCVMFVIAIFHCFVTDHLLFSTWSSDG